MKLRNFVLIPIAMLLAVGVSAETGFGLSRVVNGVPAISAPVPEDLIIGDDPLDETMVITDLFAYQGNIHIINQGSLIVQTEAGHLLLEGNLYVMDSGTFRVSGGIFTLNQTVRYQYGYSAADNGQIEFTNAEIRCNGVPGNALFNGNASVTFTDTDADVHCTAMAADTATVNVTGSSHSLELILADAAQATFTDSSDSILWLGFMTGTVADFTMPDTSGSLDWEFNSDLPGVTGVDYRLTVSGCTDMILGLISWENSDITVRDSDVRVVGIYFGGSILQTINGLVNNSSYPDNAFGFTDRTLRMINTTVRTWNLYGGGSQPLELTGCILGEVITYGTSICTMNQCMVDGTGGYLGASDSSFLQCAFCSTTAEIVNTGSSIFLYTYSSQSGNRLVMRESAVGLLFNSTLFMEPVLRDSAMAFDLALTEPFWQAPLECDVPVRGTSRLLTGPENTTTFEQAWLEYGEGEAPAEWTDLGSVMTEPVMDDELAVWDTRGLTPGPYTLRMWTDGSGIDPFNVTKTVELGVYPTYTPGPSPTPTPTPVPAGLTLNLEMETTDLVPDADFRLFLEMTSGDPEPVMADIYILLMVGDFVWFWDTWSEQPDFQRRIIAGESFTEETILDFVWPDVSGTGSGEFYAAAFSPGTFDLMGDLGMVYFTW